MDRLRSTDARRVLFVVLAVALIALAGCNTGGGNGTSPETTVTDTPTPAETTTTTTTDATETTTPSEPSDRVDAETLVGAHIDAVEAATSLTDTQYVRFESSQNGSTTVIEAQQQRYLDTQNGIGLTNFSQMLSSPQGSQSQNIVTYTRANETFLRLNNSGQSAQYFYGQEPYNGSNDPSPVDFTNAGSVSIYGELNGSWVSQGTTTYNGETVTEYTASGQENLPGLANRFGQSLTEIDTINATLYVNDDGFITHMDLHISGMSNEATTTIRASFSLSDVGSTTVSEPGWLDQVNTTG